VTIPRIYLPRPLETGDLVPLEVEQVRYLRSVLRMRGKEPLLVFNGTGEEFTADLRPSQADGIRIEITGRRPAPPERIGLTLCQAIPKAEKMDAIVRHATELGAGRIIPFFAERSVPRWAAEKSPQKCSRWQKIAIEACRQCGRADIPEIGGVLSFEEMLLSGSPGCLHLIFWEEESAAGIREVLRDPEFTATQEFLLAVGPEGGFERSEVEQARLAGFHSVSMGRRVLRVDTAAAAALAILQYERGGLGGPERGGRNGG
jgi:16S rRNA (uracil1498-N3)-methyltransferase